MKVANDNPGTMPPFVIDGIALLDQINAIFHEPRPLIVSMDGREYIADIVGAAPAHWNAMFRSRREP